jgi:hypothetical protein
VGRFETKEAIADRICAHLGVRTPGFSIGSTEPKDVFIVICASLGLTFDATLTKPNLARFIVESAGNQWHPDFESAGGTVTKAGLLAVETAVKFFRP